MIEGITDKQTMFNYVARHLLTQNEQSRGRVSGSDVACVYHARGGLRCAVGCLIDDENYSIDFERQGFNKLIVKALEKSIGRPIGAIDEKAGRWFVAGSELGMLNELRIIHDTYDPSKWKGRLRMLAKLWDLEVIPELQEAS